eukprot:TRINITY_DN66355_c6_g3_i1.p1 TRINITY_DN66355_c6_g3~~TRINITY_DN66355_c6_g3_i1.p1  ORF type:complete len:345 (-),score=161.39 TRINITY_DN66355_c6_g3_i1:72-1052(-)
MSNNNSNIVNASSFETGHEEMIHDAQMDYYGKRLATASSDRTIKIFDVSGEQQQLIAHLKGHDGPVWAVDWAHPRFGNLLASCSYDRKVIVWKEESPNVWTRVYEFAGHQSSVNAVSFGPAAFGLVLACASADGAISILFYDENKKTWNNVTLKAHSGGVNGISWAPNVPKGALLAKGNVNAKPVRRLVSCGNDNCVKLWSFDDQRMEWTQEDDGKVFEHGDNQHKDWVRDVAWAPSLGLPTNTIASCSEDKTVIIWNETPQGVWRKAEVLQFEHKVWRVSWSTMGNILAVSQGDNKVSMWKESLDGKWKNLSSVTEDSADAKQDQ